jgi:hypothetical protein
MMRRVNSLKSVAAKSESLEDFGNHMRDWLHEVRHASSRIQLERLYLDEPGVLAGRFADGNVADAWLGAYAEHLAARIRRVPPEWAFHPWRVAESPWFASGPAGPRLREIALANSPLAFKRRNLFSAHVDLPLRLRAGRPRKPAELNRASNADRQRRFRERRRAELEKLRELFSALPKNTP